MLTPTFEAQIYVDEVATRADSDAADNTVSQNGHLAVTPPILGVSRIEFYRASSAVETTRDAVDPMKTPAPRPVGPSLSPITPLDDSHHELSLNFTLASESNDLQVELAGDDNECGKDGRNNDRLYDSSAVCDFVSGDAADLGAKYLGGHHVEQSNYNSSNPDSPNGSGSINVALPAGFHGGKRTMTAGDEIVGVSRESRSARTSPRDINGVARSGISVRECKVQYTKEEGRRGDETAQFQLDSKLVRLLDDLDMLRDFGEVFRKEGMTYEDLFEATPVDMHQLVPRMGPRLRLMRAIKYIREMRWDGRQQTLMPADDLPKSSNFVPQQPAVGGRATTYYSHRVPSTGVRVRSERKMALGLRARPKKINSEKNAPKRRSNWPVMSKTGTSDIVILGDCPMKWNGNNRRSNEVKYRPFVIVDTTDAESKATGIGRPRPGSSYSHRARERKSSSHGPSLNALASRIAHKLHAVPDAPMRSFSVPKLESPESIPHSRRARATLSRSESDFISPRKVKGPDDDVHVSQGEEISPRNLHGWDRLDDLDWKSDANNEYLPKDEPNRISGGHRNKDSRRVPTKQYGSNATPANTSSARRNVERPRPGQLCQWCIYAASSKVADSLHHVLTNCTCGRVANEVVKKKFTRTASRQKYRMPKAGNSEKFRYKRFLASHRNCDAYITRVTR